MRIILAAFLLHPMIGFAQLDRIRPDMAEKDFEKALPEAHRDYNAEAHWVSRPDSVKEIAGNTLWRIYRDTITNYKFISVKARGPSKQYPIADSTEVHRMKAVLDMVRVDLEKQFGNARQHYNIPLRSVGNNGLSIAYAARWMFADGTFINLSISTDFSTGNYINAPGKFVVPESEDYEMRIEITHRTSWTRLKYQLGVTSTEFFMKFPSITGDAKAMREHHYVLSDTATSNNAGWKFIFYGDTLAQMSYHAYYGTSYGAKSDADAYLRLKEKTNSIHKDGVRAFGKADSLSDQLMQQYVMPTLQNAYSQYHFYADWTEPGGLVILNFMEIGGGKNPDITFIINLFYER